MPERTTPGGDAEIEVPPDESDAVLLFYALDTQWRRGGLGGERLGLDYGAIEPVARMLEIEVKPRLLHDLRVMEGEALKTWAERSR